MSQVRMFFILFITVFFSSCEGNIRDLHWPIPAPDHVVIVFMENHTYDQIMSDSLAVYIQELAGDSHSALFTNSFAMGHPSQPNYLQLFSGSNQGIENNDHPPVHFKTKNLAANLIYAGKTFTSFAEDLPYAGYDGDVYEKYVRKHNPLTNWVGGNVNQVDSMLNQPFTSFPADFDSLPTVSYVIPNLLHDMHDSTIQAGDEWLKTNLGAYIEYAKTHNSIFILTFDEGSYEEDGDHIITIITGMKVKGGTYSELIDHLVVLRTIEDMYNLDHAGDASKVDPVYDCWE